MGRQEQATMMRDAGMFFPFCSLAICSAVGTFHCSCVSLEVFVAHKQIWTTNLTPTRYRYALNWSGKKLGSRFDGKTPMVSRISHHPMVPPFPGATPLCGAPPRSRVALCFDQLGPVAALDAAAAAQRLSGSAVPGMVRGDLNTA